MKKTLIILTILLELNSLGQKNLKTFKGELTFKDNWFYAPITRQFYDTVVTYSVFKVNENTILTHYVFYSEDHVSDLDYIPFNYIIKNDTIFIKYLNPLTKTFVTNPTYSLRKEDTLKGSTCFKFILDSIDEKGETKYFIDACNSDFDDMDVTYRGDTIIKWNEYLFNCFVFDEQRITANIRGANFRRIILFDKYSLLPIDIKEYTYFAKFSRGNRKIPKEKWLLTRHRKLINVSADR